MEELKCEAMKNLQKALIGKDAGKAVVLLGAATSVCPEGDALGAKDNEDDEDFMATRIYCLLIWASRRNCFHLWNCRFRCSAEKLRRTRRMRST